MKYFCKNIASFKESNSIVIYALDIKERENVCFVVKNFTNYFYIKSKNIVDEESFENFKKEYSNKNITYNLSKGNHFMSNYSQESYFVKVSYNIKHDDNIYSIFNSRGFTIYSHNIDIVNKFMLKTKITLGSVFVVENAIKGNPMLNITKFKEFYVSEENLKRLNENFDCKEIETSSMKVWLRFPNNKIAIWSKEECKKIKMHPLEMVDEDTNPIQYIIHSNLKKDNVMVCNLFVSDDYVLDEEKTTLSFMEDEKIAKRLIKHSDKFNYHVKKHVFNNEKELIHCFLEFMEKDNSILIGDDIFKEIDYIKNRLIYLESKVTIENFFYHKINHTDNKKYKKILENEKNAKKILNYDPDDSITNMGLIIDKIILDVVEITNKENYVKVSNNISIHDLHYGTFGKHIKIPEKIEDQLILSVKLTIMMLELCLKHEIISNIYCSCKLNITTIQQEVKRTVFSTVKNMIIRECYEVGNMFTNDYYAQEKENYEGGYITEVKREFKNKVLSILDFKSLYPSIIITYNICKTTKIDEENIKDFKKEDYHEINIDGSKKTCYFVKKHIKEGILPAILNKSVQYRQEIQKLMSKTEDHYEKNMLEKKQNIIKKNNNCVYGILSYFDTDLSASVTSIGRMLIIYTSNYINNMEITYKKDKISINSNIENFDHNKKLDSYKNEYTEFIHTDSVVFSDIKIPDKMKKYTFYYYKLLSEEICKQINKKLNNDKENNKLELKFEGLYIRSLFVNSNNYFALFYIPNQKIEDDEVDLFSDCELKEKGTCTIVSNSISFVKIATSGIISELFMRDRSYSYFDLDEAKKYIYRYLFIDIDRHVTKSNFIVRSKYKKDAEDYKMNPEFINLIEMKKICREITNPRKGSYFKYFLSNSIIYYKDFVKLKEKLNVKIYIGHIKRFMKDILDCIFEDNYTDQLKEDFGLRDTENEKRFSDIYFENKKFVLSDEKGYCCSCSPNNNYNFNCGNVINYFGCEV